MPLQLYGSLIISGNLGSFLRDHKYAVCAGSSVCSYWWMLVQETENWMEVVGVVLVLFAVMFSSIVETFKSFKTKALNEQELKNLRHIWFLAGAKLTLNYRHNWAGDVWGSQGRGWLVEMARVVVGRGHKVTWPIPALTTWNGDPHSLDNKKRPAMCLTRNILWGTCDGKDSSLILRTIDLY